MISRRVVLMLTFSVINFLLYITGMIISIKNKELYKFFIHLTVWNLLSSSVYLMIVALFEFYNKESSQIYKFIINRINKYLISTCGTVVFSYWLLFMMGEDVMFRGNGIVYNLGNVYVHLIIGFIFLAEFFTNKNRMYIKGKFFEDLLISIVLMIIYTANILVISKVFLAKKVEENIHYAIYPFLAKSLVSSIAYSIFICIMYFNSYLLYYALSRRYNNGVISIEEEKERSETLSSKLETV